MRHTPEMRLHVTLDTDLVAELRATVPWGERSRFIAHAIRRTLAEVQSLDSGASEEPVRSPAQDPGASDSASRSG